MCILLKLNYAKFSVSNLSFFQKLSKKNLWRVGSTPVGTVGLKGNHIDMYGPFTAHATANLSRTARYFSVL